MNLRPDLRSSPWLAAAYSWFHGTRLSVSGSGHRIERRNARICRTTIEVHGRNCRLVFGARVRLWDCSISVVGDGVELVIGDHCRIRRARLVVEDRGSRLLIGNETSMTGPTLLSQEGRLLQIGRDCMIGQYAELRNSDSHPILDAASQERLNPAADVLIGDHVWIGLGAYVFKGARIGDGAIIGAGSFVTREIPPRCLALGSPAVPRRQGVDWRRPRV